MSYVSCFSGIGGLEGSTPPLAICEIDHSCQMVLKRKFPSSVIFDDIADLGGIDSDVIVGGWPCQDLSVAGQQRGLSGPNSKLFYAFVAAAVRVNARTIIAENVPNLLRLSDGNVFKEVLSEFSRNGYEFCSWRSLNAREFGLPHNRNRIFIIASKSKDDCFSLFRDPPNEVSTDQKDEAAGFYWTAGIHSIVYSKGFVPTIKVGSSLSIPSPPAIHYNHRVRQLSPFEALRLQGFSTKHFDGIKRNIIYRMAGNAVSVPVGKFVVDGVMNPTGKTNVRFLPKQPSLFSEYDGENIDPFSGAIPKNGFFHHVIKAVSVRKATFLASNLMGFLDLSNTEILSKRASKGLLARLEKSGLECPPTLRADLESISESV